VKGKAGFDINAPVNSPTNIPFGGRRKAIRLRSVKGDVFKAEFYRFLALSRPTDEEIEASGFPPGYVHVPDYMDAEFCKQLTAERRVRRKTGRYEWKKEHEANEALDCRVYTRAALWTMGVAAWKPSRWKMLREIRGLDREAAEKTSPAPAFRPPVQQGRRTVRSGYMAR
jgi:phage terminase large subunit GpA-like protein